MWASLVATPLTLLLGLSLSLFFAHTKALGERGWGRDGGGGGVTTRRKETEGDISLHNNIAKTHKKRAGPSSPDLRPLSLSRLRDSRPCRVEKKCVQKSEIKRAPGSGKENYSLTHSADVIRHKKAEKPCGGEGGWGGIGSELDMYTRRGLTDLAKMSIVLTDGITAKNEGITKIASSTKCSRRSKINSIRSEDSGDRTKVKCPQATSNVASLTNRNAG